jgi:hypothetical protein
MIHNVNMNIPVLPVVSSKARSTVEIFKNKKVLAQVMKIQKSRLVFKLSLLKRLNSIESRLNFKFLGRSLP